MPLQNYDDAGITIKVDPVHMMEMAEHVIPQHGSQIADSIGAIQSVWEGLKLGWVGNTADEAQKFNDDWRRAITGLFGTKDDPGAGILSKIAKGVAIASDNFTQAEASVDKMFTMIWLNSGGGHIQLDGTQAPPPPPDGPVDPNRNVPGGPISEHTPS